MTYKLLLINPWEGEIFPPPSIGYLQASIKQAFPSYNITAVDLNNLHMVNDDYDLVGVSFHSFSVKQAGLIQNKFKKSKLICGGHHPSSLPEQMKAMGYEVIIGEGENQLIQYLGGPENFYKNIDEYPIPDYTGLTGDWTYMGYPIISSRGCPFNCNFCASSAFWNRKWQARSAKNIITEILHRIKENHIITWMFEDDNFTLNKDRTIEICERIVKDIHPTYGPMRWQCASRAETLNDLDLCKALQQAGCDTVWIGVESLSQDSLDRISKRTTVDLMLNGIKMAESHGIHTMSQFIIGIPGDTIDNIMETSQRIRTSSISRFGSNICWILPNTDIHKKAKKYGFDDIEYLRTGDLFYTYEQPMNTLYQWMHIINTSKN